MTFLGLVIILVVVGVILWFVNLPTAPIHHMVKWAINIVGAVFVLWVLLVAFGLVGYLEMPLPKAR